MRLKFSLTYPLLISLESQVSIVPALFILASLCSLSVNLSATELLTIPLTLKDISARREAILFYKGHGGCDAH